MYEVLITGGAGFIGSNLARSLVAQGHKVRVLDTLSPQIHGETPEESPLYQSLPPEVEFIRGDVTSRDDLEAAIRGQNVVVHFAAETGTGQSMYQIEQYSRVNIGGTALLLDLLANTSHDVKRVVVASSRSIYGEGRYWSEELGHVYPSHRSADDMSSGDFEVKYPGAEALKLVATDEDSKIHPSSVYGISKQTQEQLVMTVCPSIGIEGVALRYQNVYGPGQSLSNPYTGILSIFSTLIRNGKSINIFEDGEESRDFVFIDDVVAATVAAIERPEAAGHVINVGTGVPTDVVKVATLLVKELEAPETQIAVSGNFRLGDIRHNYACLDKARALLGFEPKVSFEAGLERFCKWVQGMATVESKFDDSIKEMREKGLLK